MMNLLVAIDKLSMDGVSPSCIALNLRDTRAVFADRDCRLTVCTLRGADPGADVLEAAGMAVVRLGVKSVSPQVLPRLLRTARQCRADILHAHGYAAANYGRVTGRLLGIPVVVHEHAVLRVRPHQFVVDWLCRSLTTRAVAVSSAVAEFMVKGRSIPRERIEILHNGIDLKRFWRAAESSPESCRRRLGLPEEGLLVGTAARFREEKGLHILIETAACLCAERQDLRFVLAGEGPERERLERLVGERGLRDSVAFPGFVDDIPVFMRALTLLAMPSLSEGFPFAALEAMATGTPLVASNVGGLPEIVEDGVNGVLCAPGDRDALATAIARLLDDVALRARVAEAGRVSSARYSMENYVDGLVALYARLCAGTTAR